MEEVPSIPAKVNEYKKITEVIPKNSILRLIVVKQEDGLGGPFGPSHTVIGDGSINALFGSAGGLTSDNYRLFPAAVFPTLYKSGAKPGMDIVPPTVTNDFLIITKDKIWRAQVREDGNQAGYPIVCIITDGEVRYDYELPRLNSKK